MKTTKQHILTIKQQETTCLLYKLLSKVTECDMHVWCAVKIPIRFILMTAFPEKKNRIIKFSNENGEI